MDSLHYILGGVSLVSVATCIWQYFDNIKLTKQSHVDKADVQRHYEDSIQCANENQELEELIKVYEIDLAKVSLERDELKRQWNNIQNMKVVSFANLDMIRQGAQNKLL